MPKCKCDTRSNVQDSRRQNGSIWRRRSCPSCGATWHTYEWEKSELQQLVSRNTEALKAENATLKRHLRVIKKILSHVPVPDR